jgi:hypothetical protein
MNPARSLLVSSITAALTLAVATGAGAGTTGGALSPAAYRSQASALCVQANKRIAALPKSASTKPAQLAKALSKALDALAPLVPNFRALRPPAAQKALHDRTVDGLAAGLAIGGQIAALIAKGGNLQEAMAKVQVPFLQAISAIQTGFKGLGLTKCESVLGAAIGGGS